MKFRLIGEKICMYVCAGGSVCAGEYVCMCVLEAM